MAKGKQAAGNKAKGSGKFILFHFMFFFSYKKRYIDKEAKNDGKLKSAQSIKVRIYNINDD